MPLRNVSPDRSRGAPTSNKHKGHQQSKDKAAYAAYRKSGRRELNRERRMARILKGFDTVGRRGKGYKNLIPVKHVIMMGSNGGFIVRVEY